MPAQNFCMHAGAQVWIQSQNSHVGRYLFAGCQYVNSIRYLLLQRRKTFAVTFDVYYLG